MDFIELPLGTKYEDVPDLGGGNFDGGDFETYPQRQGWDLDALLNGNIPAAYGSWDEVGKAYGPELLAAFDGWDTGVLANHNFQSTYDSWEAISESNPLHAKQEEAVKAVARRMTLSVVGSFIQTWIMLGVLSVILRRPVSRHEVIEVRESIGENGEKTQRHLITLRAIFAECVFKFRDQLESDVQWSDEVRGSLRIGLTFLDDMQAKVLAPARYDLLPRLVELSLLLLLNTLDHHQVFHSRRKVRANMYSCASLEQETMKQQAWCPHMIYKLRTMGGAQSLYYTTRIPGFGVGGIHNQCDEGICVAFNIDHDSYQTQHSEHCSEKKRHCSCHDAEVSECQLASAFEDGGYPLVCFEHEQVKLVKYTPGAQYVAISHVWSDGMGNPKQNSLPLCQLRSIQRWCSDLAHGPTLFWIDTLCVPMKEPMRNTAIMRMAQTYENANQVLVLSEELLTRKLPVLILETVYLIFYCKWMTRLWTLQEAVLASKLMFQFRDQAISLSALDAVLESPDVPLVNEHSQSRMAALLMLTQMQLFEGGKSNGGPARNRLSLQDLIWAWQSRTSSRLSDATICASILTGTHLEPILAAPKETKMQTFWACQEELFIGILWARTPRLERAGFRWAPRDLLHPLTRQSLLPGHAGQTTSATMTENGLLVSGIAVFLLEGTSSTDDPPPASKFDYCCTVIDADTVVRIHLDDGGESWQQLLAKAQLLLFLAEFEYTKDTRQVCLASPLGSVETSGTEVEQEYLEVQYIMNGAIEVIEGGGLSEEDQLRPSVKVVQVFEPSQKWLMT